MLFAYFTKCKHDGCVFCGLTVLVVLPDLFYKNEYHGYGILPVTI